VNNDDPFKLRVLKALTNVIKEVTPANGYTFNLADFDPGDGVDSPRVFRGRPWFGDSDPIPMVSILEPIEEADLLFTPGPDDTSGSYEWPLLVQGFVADDPDHPTDPAYRLMRDVRRRLVGEKARPATDRPNQLDPLGSRQFNLSGCRVSDLRVSTGKVRPADDVSAKAYFWLVVTLTITEDAEQA
jgi:hypothetical protein